MINNLVSYVTVAVIVLASALLTNTQQLDNYGQCTSPNGERGQCIDLYNCTSIKNMLFKKPLTDDEKSFIRRSQCGYQSGNILVCCPKQRSETPSPQAPELPRPSGNTSTSSVDQHMFNYGRCSTPKGERALCIALNRCAVINDLLKKHPLPAEDKTFISRSQCGFIDGTVLVCCPGRYYGMQPSGVADRSLGSDTLPDPGVCGNVISDRVLGGNVTLIDEFPWMALIGYQMNGEHRGHKCGASLINERYVVTAAHCIHSIPSDWLPVNVRLGEWNTSTDHDCVLDSQGYQDCADPHLDIKIDRVISHEDYDPKSKSRFNDIALIRLAESVKFTDFIRPICLPLKEELKKNNFLGTVMEVAGWGLTEHNTASPVKLKADLPIAVLSDCQKALEDYNFTLQNTQLCAGGVAGIDSCRGDSGGPLVALDISNKEQTYFFLHGIVSFGPYPCGKGPGVYTKVSSYTDWIIKNIVLTESLFKPIRARNAGPQIFS